MFSCDTGAVGWCNGAGHGVLLIWIIEGQRPTALTVGAGGGGWTVFSLIYHFSLLSPSLWEMDNIDCNTVSKGRNPKQTINQPILVIHFIFKTAITITTDKTSNLFLPNSIKPLNLHQNKNVEKICRWTNKIIRLIQNNSSHCPQ